MGIVLCCKSLVLGCRYEVRMSCSIGIGWNTRKGSSWSYYCRKIWQTCNKSRSMQKRYKVVAKYSISLMSCTRNLDTSMLLTIRRKNLRHEKKTLYSLYYFSNYSFQSIHCPVLLINDPHYLCKSSVPQILLSSPTHLYFSGEMWSYSWRAPETWFSKQFLWIGMETGERFEIIPTCLSVR